MLASTLEFRRADRTRRPCRERLLELFATGPDVLGVPAPDTTVVVAEPFDAR